MYRELDPAEMGAIVSQINHINDVFRLLAHLEHKFEFRSTLVTRSDVEDEFRQAWEFDPDTPSEGPLPSMTEEQWETFAAEWFWRKGYSDIFWDGVVEAIRWDLREAKIIPEDAVVE